MAEASFGGLVTWQVSVAGTEIPTEYVVECIEIEHSVNRIGRARIRVRDGDAATQDFAISASATFMPGSAVSISLGYDSTNTELFKGVITGQSLSLNGRSNSTLEVECQDSAAMLTIGRKSCAYSQSTDSDAISQILSKAGLETDVTATSNTLAELVQYDCSDWDFIINRAEVNGMLVLALNGKVKVFNPLDQSAASVTLTHGVDLLGFDGALNALGQLDQVTASAWDPINRNLLTATASSSFAGPGNLTTKKLAQLMSQGDYGLQTAGAKTSDGLTGWAKAQVAKSELAKIIATATIAGRADLSAGQTVVLAGLGERFNGTHLVTGLRHDVQGGDWRCELTLGHERHWFAETHNVNTPPAAGLLPGAQGLFNGTVLKIDADPDNQFRVQVEVPLFNDKNTGLWARLAQFYATDGQGAFFMPEVGDEVVLGFLNADPRYPVILGSLYGKNRKPNPALTPDAENSQKALYSKNGLYLLFNDKDKIITLSTPGGNKLVLDDKNGQIQIIDQNSNSIQMDSNGITIKSASALTVQAAQALDLKGDTGVSAESSGGDVAVKGVNVALTAQAQLTAKGSATAAIEGGAQLTLKGGMVMIN